MDAAIAAALAQGADSTTAPAEHAAEEPFAAADRQRLVVSRLRPRGIHMMKQTLAKVGRMLVLPSVNFLAGSQGSAATWRLRKQSVPSTAASVVLHRSMRRRAFARMARWRPGAASTSA